jgi:tctex1 domain-containing protein 2
MPCRWAKEIADDIKHELKGKNWPRYKYVVHVVIGEQKGEGIKVACRCFWDSNTDAFAKETYESKSIFAVASVYGVYYY